MNHVRVWTRAIAWTAFDRLGDALAAFVMPGISKYIQSLLPVPTTPWASAALVSEKTIDGAIVGGFAARAGAKYAIPKGLPQQGSRALAIENEPHEVDGYSGEITEGYGKGTKTLLADETVIVKIAGKSLVSRMNYHVHDADRAGLHYDLVVRDVPPGTKEWELNIPRGPYKGRFAFRETERGMMVIPMKDRGVALPKPDYNLRSEDWLKSLPASDTRNYVIERKYDGSLSNTEISESYRAAFRSHREGGETYYDRLPALEFLTNQSPFATLRILDPGPNLAGTIIKGELVHKDGVSRVSGILNSHPEKARIVQEKRGPVEFYAWDVVRIKNRDVSKLPEWQRRELLESLVQQIRMYNKHWHIAERYDGNDPITFYHQIVSDSRGLPYSEGIVLKPREDPVGGRWLKVKNRDFTDLVVVSISPSPPGTKYSSSAAVMVMEDPRTGTQGEVGSFAISDAERQWIYDHKDELIGAVAKVSVQEMTDAGAPRAGIFHGWHPDPRYGGIGSEMALQMYSETTAGMDPKKASGPCTS